MSAGIKSWLQLPDSLADLVPRGAGALFFIQIFSTLSFSVLYSTLVLYITKQLHLSDTVATSITATFVAFNFALHLLGGYTGGRFLSYRLLFLLGMALQVLGCLALSVQSVSMLYWGLAGFLAGSGLNVTCINCMLTQLFSPEDKRREGAFLWNYSGMNIGFFIGFSISGYFQLQGNYHQLFMLSSLGNLIAFFVCLINWSKLADISTSLARLDSKRRLQKGLFGVAMIILLVPALQFAVEHAVFSNNLIMTIGIMMAFIIAYLAYKQPTIAARNKLIAYLFLGFTSLVFWTLYQLAPMGLTLFIQRNVDRHFLGFLIAPQWIQNINTLIIIIGGPALTFLFARWRRRGRNISIPFQFALAMLLIGLGYTLLPLGIKFANTQGYTNINWIIACYALTSLGELFISPIGYAMIGQLAPTHLQGVLMGTWLMITGVAATLSNLFSKMALGHTLSMNPLQTNASYSHTFILLGSTSIIVGLLLFICMPVLIRLTEETVTVDISVSKQSQLREA